MEIIVKLLKSLIVLLIFAVIVVLMLKLTRDVVVSFTFYTKSDKTLPPTEQYSTSIEPAKDGKYFIRFKNVIGTSANLNENIYYNFDITIETRSKLVADKISINQAYSVEVIRRSIGDFRVEDMNTPKGREYMKSQIQKALNDRFGEGSVDDVYLEKFLHQSR